MKILDLQVEFGGRVDSRSFGHLEHFFELSLCKTHTIIMQKAYYPSGAVMYRYDESEKDVIEKWIASSVKRAEAIEKQKKEREARKNEQKGTIH